MSIKLGLAKKWRKCIYIDGRLYRSSDDILICDMIKGNESHAKIFNSEFLIPFSNNLKMLHFYLIPIRIGCLVT